MNATSPQHLVYSKTKEETILYRLEPVSVLSQAADSKGFNDSIPNIVKR